MNYKFVNNKVVGLLCYCYLTIFFFFSLQVSASDPDCGVNAMVNYTLGESPSRTNHFYMKSVSGEICIAQDLDFESRSSYEFPVVATDRGKETQ